MTRVLFDLLPRARVHYAPSPECTRDRQGSNVLHVSGNYVEDASPSQQRWKCVTFTNPLQREPEGEEVKEHTWDAEDRSLFVCLDLKEGEDSFCRNLEQHLPTIKKLCIHGDELCQKRPIVEVLTRNTAPQMEILAINCLNPHRRTRSDLEPDELFCNYAPRLWSMTVIPGMEVLPSALSQLKWYRVLHRAGELVNGFDLHAQLSRMTSLEILEIDSDTHDAYLGKLDWEERSEIQLHRLRILTVKETTSNCKQLFAKITVPAPCCVKVTFCRPNSQGVCSLARRWITAGRDGVTNDRRTVQRIPDANGGGDDDDLILHIMKTYSMEKGFHATWTFEGRLAAQVYAGVETG